VRARNQKDPAQQSFAEELFFAPAPDPRLQEEKTPQTSPVEEAASLDALSLPIYRVSLVRDGQITMSERPQITDPKSVADLLYDYLCDKDREYFILLMLDTKNRVIGMNVVSIGILDSALVSPREVFKAALLANAASVIVSHNHPSGDPTPSAEDKRITQRLVEAGNIIHIAVLDHIIIGEQGQFVSLKERGLM
jgi:DNA repair protein RadC